MIIQNNQSEKVQIIGENTSKKATISGNKAAKLQYLLTEGLYSDAVTAVITEITNNAIDSVVEAGFDPVKNPVRVELSSQGSYKLTIQDFGLGMDKDFFENFFMCYLESTKEDSDGSIGCWGIGGKSWSSLKRSVNFTIVKEGIKCKYLCYKGLEGVEFDLLSEEQTDDKNGVLFEMNIKDWSEYNEFKNKAKKTLTYYDTVVLIIDGVPYENKVFRNELFQFAEDTPYDELHISLKDVVYKIDWYKLGIKRIDIPVAIRFDLKCGITPAPSREVILYSNQTVELLKSKIKEVADWFINKYNEKVNEFDNIFDAWNHIGNRTKKVELEGDSFDCSDLENYSSLRFNKPKIKGLKLKEPEYYKSMTNELIGEFDAIALDSSGIWKKKHISWELMNKFTREEIKIIRFDHNLAGRVKTYLRDSIGGGTLYIHKHKTYTLRNYRSILYLMLDQKSTWRERIKEFQLVQSQIIERRFKDLSDIESSQEYITWLAENKALTNEKRKETIKNGTYEGLNKQQGEITIRKVRSPRWGSNATFTASTEKIENLKKLHGLHVYFEKDQEDLEHVLILHKAFHKVRFIQLNTREVKHIKHLKNWKSMEEFKNSKPFARLATGIEISKLKVPNNEDVIYETFPKYKEIRDKLNNYLVDNSPGYLSDDNEHVIMNFARANNIYDSSIYSDLLEFKNLMKSFGFLNYLEIDDFDNLGDDEQKIIKNMVYIMLKNKKINCKFVEDYELVERVPEEVYMQEEEKETILELQSA